MPHIYKNVHMNVHSSQKVETTQMSINRGWIKKLWAIYTTEYYIAIKRNGIQVPTTVSMNLGNIMLINLHTELRQARLMCSLVRGRWRSRGWLKESPARAYGGGDGDILVFELCPAVMAMLNLWKIISLYPYDTYIFWIYVILQYNFKKWNQKIATVK